MLPIEEPSISDEVMWSKGTKECYTLRYNWSGHKGETSAMDEFIKFVKGRIKMHNLGTDHRYCHIYICMN